VLQTNHEYRSAGHQETAVARGVREDGGGRSTVYSDSVPL
jgi:hypothetical protein